MQVVAEKFKTSFFAISGSSQIHRTQTFKYMSWAHKIFISQIFLLNIKNVKFNFKMGCIPVVFPFL